MDGPTETRCSRCGAVNRIPSDKSHLRARCGRCRRAAWCGPCRTLAPVIDALARAYAGRVRVAKLNVDENPGVASRYGIQGIPTLLLFEGGHLRDRLVGMQPRATLEAWRESRLARTTR